MEEFEEKVGSLVSGLIFRFDGPNVRVDLGRTEAIMAAEDRIPNERLNLNQRLTFLNQGNKRNPKGKRNLSCPVLIPNLLRNFLPEKYLKFLQNQLKLKR